MSHLKKLRENNTATHKPPKRKQILRRMEISKTENKGKIVKLDKAKILSLKKVNKIEKNSGKIEQLKRNKTKFIL